MLVVDVAAGREVIERHAVRRLHHHEPPKAGRLWQTQQGGDVARCGDVVTTRDDGVVQVSSNHLFLKLLFALCWQHHPTLIMHCDLVVSA